MIVVVSSHLPEGEPYQSGRYEVAPVVCTDDLAYWRGLSAVWDQPITIMVVEHDMECSDSLIADLLECPEPLCTHAYTLYWASTHQAPHYAHRSGGLAAGVWVTEGAPGATFSGIGLCKITPAARTAPLLESHWSLLDVEVNRATVGHWHIHWQRDADGNPCGVEHYHQ